MPIIRIFRGTVLAGRESDWQDRVERLSLPWLMAQPGLVAHHPGRPMPGSGQRTFCMFMVWENIEAVERAFGPNWQATLVYHGDEQEMIESSSVEHFEAYGSV
ncbi:hypothetical protein FJV76_14595 [Mesorhizobium sp. WSM4303]|uniref:hypothetical protein n=1 Tax=unclassified Mesorhizobium TaxID=325217 RepID=UPI00115E479F|nr:MULTISPECIES: hypothetical protein [unclassified Mesorhizobium]TRC94793.1 hypothetical protein FJV77_17595 [Mesorhizobium sp. WSM4306]TRD03856.1 hypothetical protein FJV76_14595 [Mesorhizobium sp. WSM4303]